MDDPHAITTLDALAALYDLPSERAILKQTDRLDEHSRAFIAASPFLLLATCGSTTGADCSPRGDRPGFVEVLDDRALLIPDRRGNNRTDSLRNIVEHPTVGLLFPVPGVNESFRVNGAARISADPALLDRFAVDGHPPRTVLVVAVQEAFMHCSRALLRSDLWNPARHVERATLPSAGTMLAAHTKGNVDAAAHDAFAADTLAKTLY